MTNPCAPTVFEWNAPGPGQWAVDRSHMPAGATPLMQWMMENSMEPGMRRVCKENGTPIDAMSTRFVHGQMYTRIRPLVRPDKPPKKLPPLLVLKLATRLHPEMRRRNKRCGETMVDKPWNRVMHDWANGGKRRIEAANQALQDVRLAELSNDQLVAHVARCIDHAREQYEHHFWLHGFDLAPLGQLLHTCIAWGVEPNRVLSLLEGASPSTSEPLRQLVAIRRLVEATGATPRNLTELRELSSELDQSVGAYLARRGHVLFSRYDFDGVTLGERPDLVFASIMNAVVVDTSAAVAERTATVRSELAAEHRDEFDVLLTEARGAMDLRDDNGPTTAEWPTGIVRIGLVELGGRLAVGGRLHTAEHIFEVRRAEVTGALFDGPPIAAEFAARADLRAAQKAAAAAAPDTLGPAEPAPPPDVLPANLATVAGMVQTVVAFLGMAGTSAGADPLAGSGIGTTVVRGVARLATDPEEALDALKPGDVLVVAGTTPAYNLVLSIAGAVVTADGGPMSHAAVIARELGIPAVIGARGALTEIPNGALVEVDPVAGRVRVLSSD
jgi:rifampicin phosphotransferase